MNGSKENERAIEFLEEIIGPGAVVLDGFNEAIIGTTDDDRVAYDYDKMVEILIKQWNMTPEMAVEYIDNNTVGMSYDGRNPVIITVFSERERKAMLL